MAILQSTLMKSFNLRTSATIILHIALICKLTAQSYFISGAREAAMANSILTLGGTWSVFHNPAGIANANQTSLGISYENRYQIDEISTKSFAGIVPVGNGGFGTSYSYFGTSTYNEQKLGLGYAHSLGNKFSAGIMLDLYTSNLPSEYESAHALAGEIGIIARPINQLSIGVHLNNVTNSGFTEYSYEEPGMFFRSGITWNDPNFLIGTQLTLSKHYQPIYSIGAEIMLVKNLDVRAGISSDESSNFSFGLGYKQKRWLGDIAFARHASLGYYSSISLEFFLVKQR